MILVNGCPGEHVAATDRGLLLGDGLFETLRMRNGQPQLWDYHWRRLTEGLERLGIAAPDPVQCREELRRVAPGPVALARLTVTRGSGPRGYRPPEPAHPTRIVSGSSDSGAVADPWKPPVLRLGWGSVALGINPVLAGLKHTSRLEHVLARSAWEPGWDEAILRDARDRVVSATQGNLWVRDGNTLITPPVDEAGIAGTRRAWILEHARSFGMRVEVAYPTPGQVREADGLYVSNARVGIVPAHLEETEIERRAWQDDPVSTLGNALHEAP